MERAAGADHRSAPAIDKRGFQIIFSCYAKRRKGLPSTENVSW